MNLKAQLAKHYINLRGWKTQRKIVVIESDDWGSIRMPSKQVVDLFKSKNYPLEINKFTLFDGLERQVDLEELFKVLESHKDEIGNNPVITACAVVANPDFDKIRESNFKEYFFEIIAETYKNYGEENLLDFWIENGIKKNLLYPQFHGREHLNPSRWLKVLQSNNQMEKEAFDNKTLLGLIGGQTTDNDIYMAAFEAITEEDKESVSRITKEGLNMFEQTFGFKSLSFMPSQAKQFEELNETLMVCGVKFNQAGQFSLPIENGIFKTINNFWGDVDKFGIKYWRRNCTFEPYKGSKNPVDSCLQEIEIAFRCGKPAVINSHRINFTSRINKEHRDLSLQSLNDLLSKIIKKYPQVEFLNSEQLAKVMLEDDKTK
jgi:hypothetical protein